MTLGYESVRIDMQGLWDMREQLSKGEFKYELREKPDHSVRRVIGRSEKTS